MFLIEHHSSEIIAERDTLSEHDVHDDRSGSRGEIDVPLEP
jgi:hypothetical protein